MADNRNFPTKWHPMPPAPGSSGDKQLDKHARLRILQVVDLFAMIFERKTSNTRKALAFLWLLAFILSGAWTAPITANPGDNFGAVTWNTYIRDNLNYLLSGRQYVAFVNNHSSYSTTSTTFVDVDASNMILTLTPQSSRVYAEFTVTAVTTAGYLQFDIFNTTLNTRGGDATNGLTGGTNTTVCQYKIAWIFTGLTPGASTSFKLQWRVDNAAHTGTIQGNAGVAMMTGMAWEM